MRGIFWLAENLLASQEGLCYKEYVNKPNLLQSYERKNKEGSNWDS